MTPTPTNRPTPPPTRETGPRPAVRDFTGASAYAVEWDARPVYDFLFSLAEDAGSTDDLPAEDRRWLADNRAAIPRETLDLLERVGGHFNVHVAAFVVDRPELRRPDEFVEALDSAGPGPLMEAMFSEQLAGHPDERLMLSRALAGDRAAVDHFGALLPDRKREHQVALLEDPVGAHRSIVGLLRAWADRFRPIEDRITTILSRDYDARAGDRAGLDPADLIERTTAGIRWLPEAGIRRVILAPSYFSRPFNYLLAGEGWRFFGYPVADSALDPVDPLAPPLAVLRLHRALGDETRLRILKLLAGGDLYATEIAQQLDLSKPTISHHLTQLRAAGLVTVTEAGSVMYYSLRRDRLEAASLDLKGFLVR
jgi:DNA-binding transcriptional ArsR family regulator